MPAPRNSYTPANWYWAVSGIPASVWSSQRAAYVPATDAAYRAWCAAGNRPSVATGTAQLLAVLTSQWLPIIVAAGVKVTSTSTPSLNGTYAIDGDSLGQAAMIALDIADGTGLPGGGPNFTYFDSFGTHGPMTAAQFQAIYRALKNIVYGMQQSLVSLVSGGTGAFPASTVTIA